LALAAALSYGIGDFLAGVGGRRSLPALIPLIIQARRRSPGTTTRQR